MKIGRRRFVVNGAFGTLGLFTASAFGGCAVVVGGPGQAPQKEEAAPGAEKLFPRSVAGSDTAFPYLEVSGTPREIGRGIGRMFGDKIRLGFERRADWFGDLKAFAAGEGKSAYDVFVAAAQKHTPRAFSELQGWAQGAEIPFETMMVLNLKAEFGALIAKKEMAASTEAVEGNPGCSTVVFVQDGQVIHLHNEDGHEVYRDLMFMVKAVPNDGIPYVCLSYPGVLPGNAPAVNARGLVQTTNYIACKEVRLGVGRYFLDRMILEASGIDEALAWSTHPDRAFGYHHVFTSLSENRSVAVDVSPGKKEIKEINGLYYHTNHLVFDGMRDEDQDEKYVSSSSTSRWDVISRWAKGLKSTNSLTLEDLRVPLSSHDGKPYSPCRHPDGDVKGFTLAQAVFEAPGETFGIIKGQPCKGQIETYSRP